MQLTATKTRLLLSIVLLIIIALGVGVFIGGQYFFKTITPNVREAVSRAQASETTVSNLKSAQQLLDKQYKDVVPRVHDLAINAQSHQDQIINDITRYATKTGVEIKGITFETGSSVAGAGATSAPSTANSAPAAKSTQKSVAGLTPSTFSITIGNATNYRAILSFIRLTEASIPYLQLHDLSLTSGGSDTNTSTGGATAVSIPSLTFDVYLRKDAATPVTPTVGATKR